MPVRIIITIGSGIDNINHFRVLSIMLVLAAGIYIHIAQQFGAQLIFILLYLEKIYTD